MARNPRFLRSTVSIRCRLQSQLERRTSLRRCPRLVFSAQPPASGLFLPAKNATRNRETTTSAPDTMRYDGSLPLTRLERQRGTRSLREDGQPATLNLYAFVGNNPLSQVDPDGHATDAAQKGCQSDAPGLCSQVMQQVSQEAQQNQQAQAAQQQSSSSTANPNATAEQHQYDLALSRERTTFWELMTRRII